VTTKKVVVAVMTKKGRQKIERQLLQFGALIILFTTVGSAQ